MSPLLSTSKEARGEISQPITMRFRLSLGLSPPREKSFRRHKRGLISRTAAGNRAKLNIHEPWGREDGEIMQ